MRAVKLCSRISKFEVKNLIKDIFSYAILLGVLVFAIYPVLWMLFSSMKTGGELFVNRWLWPKNVTIDNFIIAWKKANFSVFFINSFLITSISVSTMIFLGAMASHAIVRFRLKLAKFCLLYFLGGMMIPPQVIFIPSIAIFQKLHLLNTRTGILLLYIGSGLSFVTFLLQGFFRGLPEELLDAAKIDGCSELGSFFRIVLPLSKAALGAVTIFQSIWVWNEFFFALAFLRKHELKTLTVGIYSLVGEYFTNYPVLFSGLSISAIPIIIIYIFFSRFFIKGVTAGAVKG